MVVTWLRALGRVSAPVIVCGVVTFMGLPADGATTTARELLWQLDVARETGSSGYDRERFGGWVDADGDGCDTREEVLIVESRTRVSRTGGCTITRGRWRSYYDGATWTDPGDVDIDHVVALGEAWWSGASGWSSSRRRRFANDLAYGPSLQAVTDNVNQSKGDGDPSEWLPDRARCRFAIQWVRVKYRWRLAVDRDERRVLSRLLSGSCGDRTVAVPPRAR